MINALSLILITYIVFQNVEKGIDGSVSNLASENHYLFAASMCSTSFFKIHDSLTTTTGTVCILKTFSFIFLLLLSIFNVNDYEKTHVACSSLYFLTSAVYCIVLNTLCGHLCVFLSLLYLYAYLYKIKNRIYIEYFLIVTHGMVM